MVYYFLAFSILSGTSSLLSVEHLKNIMESFSVCLWCMAEMFETLSAKQISLQSRDNSLKTKINLVLDGGNYAPSDCYNMLHYLECIS